MYTGLRWRHGAVSVSVGLCELLVYSCVYSVEILMLAGSMWHILHSFMICVQDAKLCFNYVNVWLWCNDHNVKCFLQHNIMTFLLILMNRICVQPMS